MPKWIYAEKQCEKCEKLIKSNCFPRHLRSCNGLKIKKVRVAWNAGLSKETDPRVATIADKCGKTLTGKTGRRHTEASKMKLSILMSERLKQSYADGTRHQVGGYCRWFEVDGVKVQGTWEYRVAKILSKWKQDRRIKDWQHGVTRVPYIFEGKIRTYIIDFTITENNGTEFCIEVKGRKSLCDPLKWEAARQILKLEVWNLKEIEIHETSL